MAELYQSKWNEIKTRRGVQDLNDLIALIEEDGTLTIEDDPSPDEIIKAREQAAKDAEKRQKDAEKEAAAQAKEDEKARAEETDAAANQRIADLPHPDDQGMDDLTENPPEGSPTAQEQEKETAKK